VEEEQSVTKPLPSPTGWGTMRVVRVSETCVLLDMVDTIC